MIQRLNVKGVPIQIQDFIFTNQRKEQRKRGCYGCGELGHFAKQTKLHQDNTIKGVKKLDEGQTVVCYVCHKEGHKVL